MEKKLDSMTDLGTSSYIGSQSEVSKIDASMLDKSISDNSEAMREHMREIGRNKTVKLNLADEIH